VGIRAVFFDAGETLVHPVPSFPELFARTVTREGHPRTAEQIADGLSMVSDEFARAAVEEELWTTHPERSRRFWIRVYERFLNELRISDANGLTDRLYTTFTTLENYDVFDDVRPTLARLRETGRALGVISNFEPWLEEKPDVAIFRLALDRAGLAASEVAYVGDIPAFDIAPAAELGMFPVLIDRRGRHETFDGPGVRITALGDLPGLLDE
jgi:putative hydrolase of the HAD superfamily